MEGYELHSSKTREAESFGKFVYSLRKKKLYKYYRQVSFAAKKYKNNLFIWIKTHFSPFPTPSVSSMHPLGMSSKGGSEHKKVRAKRNEGLAAKQEQAQPRTKSREGMQWRQARVLWLAGESHTELEERLRNPGGGSVSFPERWTGPQRFVFFEIVTCLEAETDAPRLEKRKATFSFLSRKKLKKFLLWTL